MEGDGVTKIIGHNMKRPPFTYTCPYNGKTYKRIRLEKGWEGVTWWLRNEHCWNCGRFCPSEVKA